MSKTERIILTIFSVVFLFICGVPEYIGDGFKNGLIGILHLSIFIGLVYFFVWNLGKLTDK